MQEEDIDSPISLLDENLPIDFNFVYALHTFVATLEGQVCVIRSDPLELLDDSNSYWWLIGYIPAENIETPFERLARLNRQKNSRIDEDYEEPIRNTNKLKKSLQFEIQTLIIYLDGERENGPYIDEVLDEDCSIDDNSLEDSKKSKGFRESFLFKKLLGKKKDKPDDTNDSSDIFRNNNVDVSNTEPINVLRIFAGNVDLKATFKTVAISKNMIMADLIDNALKKFRVPDANPSDYYIGVLHMDSQEKRIPENEYIFDILDSLRHKSLPGVGDFARISHAQNAKGKISSVRMNDDNIIKVIVNKKLNVFDKNLHLMRVFMFDEADETGQIRHYKTIGVTSSATIDEVIKLSEKKFKLDMEGYKCSLHSIFREQETERSREELIGEVMQMGEGSTEDIDFVLKREWIGIGTFQRHTPQIQPTAIQVLELLKSKPSFLEENSGNIVSPYSSNNTFPYDQLTGDDDPDGIVNSNIFVDRTSPQYQKQPTLQQPMQRQFIVAPPRMKSLNQTAAAAQKDNENSDSPHMRRGSSLQADEPQPGVPLQRSLTNTSTTGSSKPDFKYMEQYLDEIMKDNMNMNKLDYLENMLNNPDGTKKAGAGGGGETTAESNERSSQYSDSGLSKIINRKSQQFTPGVLPQRGTSFGNGQQAAHKSSAIGFSSSNGGTTNIRPISDYNDSGLSKIMKRKSQQTSLSRPKSPANIIGNRSSHPLTSPAPQLPMAALNGFHEQQTKPSSAPHSSINNDIIFINNNTGQKGAAAAKVRPLSLHYEGGENKPRSILGLFDGLEEEIDSLTRNRGISGFVEEGNVLAQCRDAEAQLRITENELDGILSNTLFLFK